MRLWVILYRFAWGVLLVLFAIGLVFVFLPKCRELRDLQRQRSELQDQNKRTRAQTADLRHRQEQFKSAPAFIERTARENGLAKPDEVIFQFQEAPDSRDGR